MATRIIISGTVDLPPENLEAALAAGKPLIEGARLDRVKPDPQRFFFFALAVIPRAVLQTHDQHVVADEMRRHASLKQPRVGFVCA